jgi:outer membrane lipoprotein-sorting protein
MISKYTKNFDRWNIEKQNEKLLGHNTIVLKSLDSTTAGKFKADSFRFWVDKDPGILVKYEDYWKGKVTSYLYPKSLKVNVPIDLKEFGPKL